MKFASAEIQEKPHPKVSNSKTGRKKPQPKQPTFKTESKEDLPGIAVYMKPEQDDWDFLKEMSTQRHYTLHLVQHEFLSYADD